MEESPELIIEDEYINSVQIADIDEPVQDKLKEVILETHTDENLLKTYADLFKSSLSEAFNEFYSSYIIHTVDSSFQVFRSFTYGEMAISFLLMIIILIILLKWFWEIVR